MGRVLSYWTACLKANCPAEYMAALLTSVGDDKDKMAIYLAECRRLGITVLPPDVNESGWSFTPAGTGIRFGLGAIRNVGPAVVTAIVDARREKGRYASFAGFLGKAEVTVCSKRVVESLIKAGAFDSLGHSRRSLCSVHEQAVDTVTGVKRQAPAGQLDLFAAAGPDTTGCPGSRIGLDFDLTAGEWPRKFLLSQERQMLGLYVSGHPLDGTRLLLERNRDTSIAGLLASGRTGGEARLAGMIVAVGHRTSKRSGNPWAIVTIEDLDAAVEVLFFPGVYHLHAAGLTCDAVVSVHGQISEHDGTVSIIAKDLTPLDVSSAAGPDAGPPLVITVHESQVTAGLVAGLKHILQSHPAATPVHLRLRRPGGTALVVDLPDFPVTPGRLPGRRRDRAGHQPRPPPRRPRRDRRETGARRLAVRAHRPVSTKRTASWPAETGCGASAPCRTSRSGSSASSPAPASGSPA